MQIIPADDTRMIDLPGVGPCPRPVDIDQRLTGFKRLKSLRIYRFLPGPAIHGESEVDEVFILPLSGVLDMVITGSHSFHGQLSADGPYRALYMTPHHAYRLTPLTPLIVAYVRAEAAGLIPVQALSGGESGSMAEQLRFRQISLPVGQSLDAGGPETLIHLDRGRLRFGDDVLLSGHTLALNEGEPAALMACEASDLLILSA